ncbi:MAG: hypothetical protein ABIJ91_03480 [Candidatus Kuenenbacteria bacterium]
MFDNIEDNKSINLLPYELRKKEAKEKAKKGITAIRQADFHIPQEKSAAREISLNQKKQIYEENRQKMQSLNPVKEKKKKESIFLSLFARLKKKRKNKRSESVLAIKLPKNTFEPKINKLMEEPPKNSSAPKHDNTVDKLAHQLDGKEGMRHPIALPAKQPTGKQPKEPVEERTMNFVHVPRFEEKGSDNEDLDVNLLPEMKKLPTLKKVFSYYALSAFIAVIILISFYIFFNNKAVSYGKSVNDLELEMQAVKDKISQAEDEINGLGPIAKKLDYIETLFQHHNYWSNFFPILEQHTLAEVYFTDLAVNADLSITLQGQALDLKTVAEQLFVFKNSKVYKNTKLSSLRLNNNPSEAEKRKDMEFSLTFVVDGDVIRE